MIVPVVLLSLSLLRPLVVTAQFASCIPNYFQYVPIEQNVYIGRIEIPSPPKDVPLQLSVSLSIATILPTRYVGRLELTQPRSESVKSIQRGGPLKYTIHFPLSYPIPSVNKIRFNDRELCRGARATGQVITSIVLNHTLYPPGTALLTVDDRNVDPNLQSLEEVPFQTSSPLFNDPLFTVNQSPPLPTVPSSPSPSTSVLQPAAPNFEPQVENCESEKTSKLIDFATQVQCGRKDTAVTSLVVGGTQTERDQWPWLAALFVALVPEYKFQCAGSLITTSHVITAAHCLWYNNQRLPAGALEVSLGRYRLDNFREKGSVTRQLASFTIHPDYLNQSTAYLNNADADIAIIKLREEIHYTRVIKPICLWASCTSLDPIIGILGTVVGWGRDEFGNQHTQEPRMVQVPIVSQEDCLRSDRGFIDVTSKRTFCAGSIDKTGPCNGDSGSGLVIFDSIKGRYYLRGVVSLSLLNKNTNSCDLDKYVVYTDVAKHLAWIYQQISP